MAKIDLKKQLAQQTGTRDPEAIAVTVKDVFIKDIKVRSNVRTGDSDVAELKSSIKRYGVLSPITVYQENDGYVVKTGHRRLQACIELHDQDPSQFSRIRCLISDDKNVLTIQLIENLQRKNLTPLELKNGLTQMRKQGLSINQIALAIGKKAQYVKDVFTIINAIDRDEDYQKTLSRAGTTLGHFKETQSIKNKQIRLKTIEERASGKISRERLRSKLQKKINKKNPPLMKVNQEKLTITIHAKNKTQFRKIIKIIRNDLDNEKNKIG